MKTIHINWLVVLFALGLGITTPLSWYALFFILLLWMEANLETTKKCSFCKNKFILSEDKWRAPIILFFLGYRWKFHSSFTKTCPHCKKEN